MLGVQLDILSTALCREPAGRHPCLSLTLGRGFIELISGCMNQFHPIQTKLKLLGRIQRSIQSLNFSSTSESLSTMRRTLGGRRIERSAMRVKTLRSVRHFHAYFPPLEFAASPYRDSAPENAQHNEETTPSEN